MARIGRDGPIDRDALPFGLGALGLGITGIAFLSFALQWQPVPASLAANSLLIILSGAILAVGGVLTIARGTTAIGAATLGLFFGLWVLALHLPIVVTKPSVVALLGLCEILSLAAAGLQLFVIRSRVQGGLALLPRYLFGICPLVFGLSHFVYAGFTAAMVPGWLPGPLFWAYATGVGHAAAGVAILTGWHSRLGATALAAMCGSFVVLLHIPRVIAAPGSHAEWTMTCVALSIAGAAWAMRTLPSR